MTKRITNLKYFISNYIKSSTFYTYNRGFTVLESIVAIFVLSLAISGVFASVQKNLSQSIISKDEVKAFYLAQEAIEIVRRERDENQLSRINGSSVNWNDNLCPVGQTCRVDATVLASPIQVCGTSWGSCENLRQNSSTFLYGHDSSWNLTNFKREIQIENINANEISVTVQVTWTKGALFTGSFKAKTLLMNWVY